MANVVAFGAEAVETVDDRDTRVSYAVAYAAAAGTAHRDANADEEWWEWAVCWDWIWFAVVTVDSIVICDTQQAAAGVFFDKVAL